MHRGQTLYYDSEFHLIGDGISLGGGSVEKTKWKTRVGGSQSRKRVKDLD